METEETTGNKKKAGQEQRIIGYQDEAAVCLCPPKGSTYARKGRTPVLKVADSKKYAHLSLSAYISEQGELYYEVRESSFNGAAIARFLKKSFTGRKRKKHLVIWDGATIHKSWQVKEFLEQEEKKQARVWLELLPPYSPELNPTELLWGYLKKNRLANTACRNLRELKSLVIKAMEEVKLNTELIKSFFRHKKIGFMQS